MLGGISKMLILYHKERQIRADIVFVLHSPIGLPRSSEAEREQATSVRIERDLYSCLP